MFGVSFSRVKLALRPGVRAVHLWVTRLAPEFIRFPRVLSCPIMSSRPPVAPPPVAPPRCPLWPGVPTDRRHRRRTEQATLHVRLSLIAAAIEGSFIKPVKPVDSWLRPVIGQYNVICVKYSENCQLTVPGLACHPKQMNAALMFDCREHGVLDGSHV